MKKIQAIITPSNSTIYFLFSILLNIVLSMSILEHFYRIWQHSILVIYAILFMTAIATNILFFCLKRFLINRISLSISREHLTSWSLVCFVICLSYIVIYQPDYPLAKIRTTYQLMIEPGSVKNELSTGKNIKLIELKVGEEKIPTNWNENILGVSTNPAIMILTSEKLPETMDFIFVEGQDSGIVNISIDGKLVGERDLYSATSGQASVSVDIPFPGNIGLIDKILRIFDIFSLSWLLFLLGLIIKPLNFKDPLNLTNNPLLDQQPLIKNPIVIFLMIIFITLVFQRAWVGDDAYITFRTVYNFIHGYGLTWNTFERVQAYTNPLWMLLMSAGYFVTKDVFYTSIVISLTLTIATVLLVVTRIARSTFSTVFILMAMLTSNALLDYSTSGLENSLSHFIAVLFFFFLISMKASHKKVLIVSFISSLGILNRMDSGLIFLPGLIYLFFEKRGIKSIGLMGLGQLPFLIWELFSIIYYGFPFPNTAYAKLLTGIGNAELMQRGLLYLLMSLKRDPITLIICSYAIIITLIKKDRFHYLISLGVIGYIAYIVKIGGDFMSGRFLSLPFLCALIILSRFKAPADRKPGYLFPVLIVIICAFLGSPFYNPNYPTEIASGGIADERRIYSPGSSLAKVYTSKKAPVPPWGINPKHIADDVIVYDTIGMVGYFQGPGTKIIDQLGLSDPLLSRMAPHKFNYLPGHYYRDIPEGYLETVISGTNQIKDQNLAKFYDKLIVITQSPIFSVERMKTIIEMNCGVYSDLIVR